MMSNFFNFSKRVFCAALVFNFTFGIFAESEEELKKRILSNANLAGQSEEELMSGDDENEKSGWWPFGQSEEKRLPSTFERDVPYTTQEYAIMDAYYNHEISNSQQRKKLYEDALNSANEFSDEYAKLVHLARAEYYYGISLIETFDLANFENLSDVENKGDVADNGKAGQCFDKAIEYCEAALKIKNGSDAWSLYSHSISANCTAKSWSYILGNALKVRSYAKKAIKLDYSNGTAQFLNIAQDIYAPWPICKLRSGRKKMIAILNDKYVRLDKQDRLLISAAVGYSYFKQKKWDTAIEWYNKALAVYPYNFSAHQMMGTINRRKDKK